ncbi:CocE/NonD family hydrolase [Leptobacterium flavescens]|uniref:CocE/NonD family hydrolase n=2 Tax=Leptobacterium flavescens TaxID=472055 RepID=A0A6P0UMB4_9FLAO|nr:CocE/NonD family hydrolase [Leptobacterium flavescens]
MRYLFIIAITSLLLSCKSEQQQYHFRTLTEDGKSYEILDSVLIKTRDGAQIAAMVVKPGEIKEPGTSILFHTVYARHDDIKRAKKAADKGYIGIVSYTRGKAWSPDDPIPYEHEANDTYDVIDWISRQKWSDKRVGMYGGSYVGFTQWAAAKKLHPALKTIVPSVSAAPGIAEPTENGVYVNFHYPWFHYVMEDKYLADSLYSDWQRWNNLYLEWYKKGTSYRSLDSLDGFPNREFNKKLDHPVYDNYWQDMMPYKEDFAQIDIPVLTTTGYYDGGQIGAMYYLKEHMKYNKNANHYLLIGPYTHFGAQSVPDKEIGNYTIDPVAQINITETIFQWFDHIFKDASRPELLKDKINYQVMGTNSWGHASSLKEMNNDTLRFYLNDKVSGELFESTFSGKQQHLSLSRQKEEKRSYAEQEVDLADRRDGKQNNYFSPFVINETLTLGNGISYVTEAFEEEFEMNGSYLGELKLSINKRDLDCSMVLYEQTPEGKFFKLTLAYVGRASLAKDKSKRQLLTPGEISSIPLGNVRMSSKKIGKGSRLVLVLNVNKHPHAQINYGSGKDVSDETIADAKTPLKIKWYNDSFIEIPIRRKQ